jgi:hypothetical protein
VSRPDSEKVVVGYLSPGQVESGFMESVIDLLVYDVAFKQRIVNGGGRLATQAGANCPDPETAWSGSSWSTAKPTGCSWWTRT